MKRPHCSLKAFMQSSYNAAVLETIEMKRERG
jgi:hypothetical protein